MLYIYLDFAEKQENKRKQLAMEKLSEKYSFADYDKIFNARTILKLFNAIADYYKQEKKAFGLGKEKLVCKLIDTESYYVFETKEI